MIRALEYYAAQVVEPYYAFYYPTSLGYFRLHIPFWGGFADGDYERTLAKLRS